MFRKTFLVNGLILFHGYFQTDQDNWTNVDRLFKTRYDSVTKTKAVSDDLASLQMTNFAKQGRMTRMQVQS